VIRPSLSTSNIVLFRLRYFAGEGKVEVTCRFYNLICFNHKEHKELKDQLLNASFWLSGIL
jgi:hypothetical protein